MKDLQRELEDSRAAQKETLTSARESERRSKAMEANIIQLHEVRSGGKLQFHIKCITISACVFLNLIKKTNFSIFQSPNVLCFLSSLY